MTQHISGGYNPYVHRTQSQGANAGPGVDATGGGNNFTSGSVQIVGSPQTGGYTDAGTGSATYTGSNVQPADAQVATQYVAPQTSSQVIVNPQVTAQQVQVEPQPTASAPVSSVENAATSTQATVTPATTSGAVSGGGGAVAEAAASTPPAPAPTPQAGPIPISIDWTGIEQPTAKFDDATGEIYYDGLSQDLTRAFRSLGVDENMIAWMAAKDFDDASIIEMFNSLKNRIAQGYTLEVTVTGLPEQDRTPAGDDTQSGDITTGGSEGGHSSGETGGTDGVDSAGDVAGSAGGGNVMTPEWETQIRDLLNRHVGSELIPTAEYVDDVIDLITSQENLSEKDLVLFYEDAYQSLGEAPAFDEEWQSAFEEVLAGASNKDEVLEQLANSPYSDIGLAYELMQIVQAAEGVTGDGTDGGAVEPGEDSTLSTIDPEIAAGYRDELSQVLVPDPETGEMRPINEEEVEMLLAGAPSVEALELQITRMASHGTNYWDDEIDGMFRELKVLDPATGELIPMPAEQIEMVKSENAGFYDIQAYYAQQAGMQQELEAMTVDERKELIAEQQQAMQEAFERTPTGMMMKTMESPAFQSAFTFWYMGGGRSMQAVSSGALQRIAASIPESATASQRASAFAKGMFNETANIRFARFGDKALIKALDQRPLWMKTPLVGNLGNGIRSLTGREAVQSGSRVAADITGTGGRNVGQRFSDWARGGGQTSAVSSSAPGSVTKTFANGVRQVTEHSKITMYIPEEMADDAVEIWSKTKDANKVSFRNMANGETKIVLNRPTTGSLAVRAGLPAIVLYFTGKDVLEKYQEEGEFGPETKQAALKAAGLTTAAAVGGHLIAKHALPALASTPAGAKFLTGASKWGGPAAVAAFGGLEVYSAWKAEGEFGNETKKATGSAVGGAAGAWAGGILGGMASGAVAGSLGGPPGAIAGAVVGLGIGIGSAFIGSKAGEWVGGLFGSDDAEDGAAAVNGEDEQSAAVRDAQDSAQTTAG